MTVKRHLVSSLLQTIPTFFVIITLNFVLFRLAPGDPAIYLAGEGASLKEIEAVRTRLGLDRHLFEQYAIYIGDLLRGDLGYSYSYNAPVLRVFFSALPNTLLLTLTAFLISVPLGILGGLIASKKPHSKLDSVVTVGLLAAYSAPPFWLGLIMSLVFGVILHLFPVTGMVTLVGAGGYVQDLIWHMVLPVSVLGLGTAALKFRLMKSSMLEVINKDFVTLAWSKGCDENAVYYKHSFRNALLPVLTMLGLQVRTIFEGSALVEVVFAWPGTGWLMYEAIFARDYPLLSGGLIVYSLVQILSSLFVDLLYVLVDPRIRYD